MTQFSFEYGMPIHLDCSKIINTAAFDGCYYYFPIPCEGRVLQTDLAFHTLCTFETKRKYDCLCYDYGEHCFWAAEQRYTSRIYKLDCQLREIDYLTLTHCPCPGVITGISYDCCQNCLVVAQDRALLQVEKETGCCQLLYKAHRGMLTSVLSLCPGYFITVLEQQKQCLLLLDSCGNVQSAWSIPLDALIQDILFNPCQQACPQDMLEFFILKKRCYPYLCRIPLCKLFPNFEPCGCNYEICNPPCPPPPPPPHPPHGCNDILESIALVEASLSHILNAEGEKLQKVLAETDDIEVILRTNREINRTITSATHLEQVLYAKLAALNEHCCPPEPPCPPGPCPPLPEPPCHC